MCFADIFFKSVTCLLIPLIVPYVKQKFLNFLPRPIYWSFLLLWNVFVCHVKNSLPPTDHDDVSLFSSKICIVFILYLNLWSILNYCLYIERACLRFIFCMWLSNCSNTIYWQNPAFSIKLPLHLCQKSSGHICAGLFLGPAPLIFVSHLLPAPRCFDYCSVAKS